MAAMQRRATDVVHHGDAYDHALAESRFSTLECECPAKYRFASHTDARMVLFRYIEGWYNPHRRRSVLGQRSALAFEQACAEQSVAAKEPNPAGSTETSPVHVHVPFDVSPGRAETGARPLGEADGESRRERTARARQRGAPEADTMAVVAENRCR
jgi:hypothetical protein